MAGTADHKRSRSTPRRAHPRAGRLRTGRQLGFLLAMSLVLSGGVLTTALATGTHAWLGWFALLPLFRAIQILRPLSALTAGGLWGASLYVCGTGLVDVGVPPTLLSFALLVGVSAAYTGVGAWLTRAVGFSPFLLAVGWMLVELALIPLGLGLGLLGGMLGDGLLMRVVGGLFGYAIVAFLVAIASASMLAIIIRARLGAMKPCLTLGSAVPHDTVWHWSELPVNRYQLRPSRPRSPPTGSVAFGMTFNA